MQDDKQVGANSTVKYVTVLAIVIVIGVAITGLLYFKKDTENKDTSNNKDSIEIAQSGKVGKIKAVDRRDLGLRNAHFAAGELVIGKDPVSAKKEFEEAFKKARDIRDEETIKYNIGLATDKTGDLESAYTIFKDIVANPDYLGIVKAYAIQQMMQDYYIGLDEKIYNEIFKGSPYAEFSKSSSGNKDIAMRKLIEYGSSFYPLPLLELRIASYEADSVLDVVKKYNGYTSQAKIDTQDSVNLILSKIQNTKIEIDNLIGTPNSSLLPNILNRLGVVTGKLNLAGVDGFEDPSAVFDKAIQFSLIANNIETEGYIRYNYARYQSQKKIVNKQKVVEILSPLYKTTDDRKTKLNNVYSFIKNQNPNTAIEHTNVVTLAKLDPDFGKFLTSELGWRSVK